MVDLRRKKVSISAFCSGCWVQAPLTFLWSDPLIGQSRIHIWFLSGVSIPSRPTPGELNERTLR